MFTILEMKVGIEMSFQLESSQQKLILSCVLIACFSMNWEALFALICLSAYMGKRGGHEIPAGTETAHQSACVSALVQLISPTPSNFGFPVCVCLVSPFSVMPQLLSKTNSLRESRVWLLRLKHFQKGACWHKYSNKRLGIYLLTKEAVSCPRVYV